MNYETVDDPYSDEYLYHEYVEYGDRWIYYDYLTEDFRAFFESLNPIIEVSKQLYDIACFFSLFINFFHLSILSRKTLRTNLVYLIMIGICICDIFQSLGNITQIGMDYIYQVQACYNGTRYSHLMVNLIAKTLQILCRRGSSFLALYIATIRALSVLFPMNNIISAMTQIKAGVLVMFLVSVASGSWSLVYFVKSKFVVVQNCDSEMVDYFSFTGPVVKLLRPSYLPYRLVDRETWELTYLMVDGFVAIFISICYFLVVIALVIGIRRANKIRKNVSKEEQSRTNTYALVLSMAFSLFVSEAFYAALFYASDIYFGYREQEEFKKLDSFVLTLQIVNSSVHCLICYCMSSQYRDTVRGLFGKRREDKSIVSIVRSSSE
ncbi:Protein CBG23866 [Caenorhabditis briggsae]|uniref:G-protein coupled receptors family 1 profile domain-containing protein n=2 Tax=Caenorhabditis briggsae TaxID=6238 RepID=A0AAE9A8U1_CAEBR|nr:Protein CBG23866 [Caenorhabditis briggsae]ULT93561.1 hypothetical protein L3Y34_003213 [Caenorhabditis briggsae]CAP20610.2 Protein CBG23866 [Caenorhabditis briggsae]